MAERVKEELLEKHHVDLVVGPDAYLDLPNLIGAVEQGEKAINVDLSITETYKNIIPILENLKNTSDNIDVYQQLATISALIASFLTLVDANAAENPKAYLKN